MQKGKKREEGWRKRGKKNRNLTGKMKPMC
jgi:hypothetical protein